MTVLRVPSSARATRVHTVGVVGAVALVAAATSVGPATPVLAKSTVVTISSDGRYVLAHDDWADKLVRIDRSTGAKVVVGALDVRGSSMIGDGKAVFWGDRAGAIYRQIGTAAPQQLIGGPVADWYYLSRGPIVTARWSVCSVPMVAWRRWRRASSIRPLARSYASCRATQLAGRS